MKLQDFAGSWRVTRTICHAEAPDGTFEGVATWSPDSLGLLYHEQGILQIGDHPPMQTERRYSWREGLAVHFEDGRFFHHVATDGSETVHICDPDEYRVVYSFGTWPEFRTVWRVHGPRKSYVMTTRYAPQ